jgi:synaptobrevin family protein YKT6
MLSSIQINDGQRQNTFFDLSMYPFFGRSTIKDVITVVYKESLKYITTLDDEIDEQIKYYNHEKLKDTILVVYQGNKNILVICSNQIYKRPLTTFLRKLDNVLTIDFSKRIDNISDLETEAIKDFIQNYDKYIDKIDKIDVIDKKIDDTKLIIAESINKLINRGEKIDDLLIKSDELSDLSKNFFKDSQKLNRCCTIL